LEDKSIGILFIQPSFLSKRGIFYIHFYEVSKHREKAK
jgi:hypothetical protein